MAQKALSNAEEMLQDAKILFEHERYSTATALAVIAIEEVAKWSVVQDNFTAVGNGDWKRFWHGVRNHVTKIDKHKSFSLLEALKMWNAAEPWGAVADIEDEGDLQAIKEGCLYVDHNGESVTSPRSHHNERAECECLLIKAEDYVSA